MFSKKLWLQNLHRHHAEHVPIVVVDLRVQLYRMLLMWPQADLACNGNKGMLDAWCKAQWAIILHKPISWLDAPKQGYRIILADDCKAELPHGYNYWRNEYCIKLNLEPYKGNRGLGDVAKSDSYWQLHEQAIAYFADENSPIRIFRQKGLEADDIAGECYRQIVDMCKRNVAGFSADGTGRQTFFWTSDGDWEQLINDKYSIMFANALPTKNASRLRSEYEILERYARNGWPISSPAEIPRMKSIYGDYGDNIAPGAPQLLMDLQSPPPQEFAIEHELKIAIANEIANVSSNTNTEHWQRAKSWCVRHNLPSFA